MPIIQLIDCDILCTPTSRIQSRIGGDDGYGCGSGAMYGNPYYGSGFGEATHTGDRDFCSESDRDGDGTGDAGHSERYFSGDGLSGYSSDEK